MRPLEQGEKAWVYGTALTLIMILLTVNVALADPTTEETGIEEAPEIEVPVTEVEVEEQRESALAGEDDREAEPVYSKNRTPESSAAVETVTRAEIEAMRPKDVYDIIEAAGGVSMWRQGARVHNFVKSRGDSLGIILDGVYLSTTEAQRILGDLPVELIDSVKIVRDATLLTIGPLSAFGSGSGSPNQGFIFINTKKGKVRENQATVGYGTFNTEKAILFHGDSCCDSKLTYGIGYAGARSDGKTDWNNAYGFQSLIANGGWTTQDLILGFSCYANNGWREVQRHIKEGTLNSNTWKYDPMDTSLITLNIAKSWNEKNITNFTYGYTKATGEQYAYTATGDNSAVTGRKSVDRVNEINLLHTLIWGRNTLKIGTQALRWYQLTEGQTTPREEEVYGYYVTNESRIGEKWVVDEGFRLDRKYVIRGGDKYLDDGNLVRLTDGHWTDNATSLSVGAAYRVSPLYKLSGRIACNHTPTPETLPTRNNRELPAEDRLKYELGIEARCHRMFNPALTFFYYDIANSKISDGTVAVSGSTTGETITVYKTAADIVRKGFELGINGNLSAALRYRAGYTWFDSDNPTAEALAETQRQDELKGKYSLGLIYRTHGFDAGLTVLHVDPYNSYGMTVGDFTIVNLSVAKEFAQKYKLTVYGQNITDVAYATNNKGYPPKAAWGCLYDVGAVYGVEWSVKF
jgi:outer membrane receptor for ferrienterochelin and colicin